MRGGFGRRKGFCLSRKSHRINLGRPAADSIFASPTAAPKGLREYTIGCWAGANSIHVLAQGGWAVPSV